MKKKSLILILTTIVIVSCFVAYKYLTRLDYNKIIFVLSSSNRASSPYFYQKDGDFFLADDLRLGFEKLGYTVEYKFREDYDDLKLGNTGNIIYFKGYYDFKTLPENNSLEDKRKRILYIYYMEGLKEQVLTEVDKIASSSQRLIRETLIPKKLDATYIPQFTNPNKFNKISTNTNPNKKSEVLFVGSDHTKYGRTCIDYALLANANLSLYGKFWEDTVSSKYLKGNFIENDELYEYYQNADIVLNDHRVDMKYFGFISNRIYDVTASGGFIFTDYMPEIKEAYGDSIATYKNYDEFKEKLEYYLTHPEVRQIMAKKAQEITLNNFTNDIAAQKFDKIFKSIQK